MTVYDLMFFVCLQDISLFYQIFPDDVLGSGQFGTVYGGEYPTWEVLLYLLNHGLH